MGKSIRLRVLASRDSLQCGPAGGVTFGLWTQDFVENKEILRWDDPARIALGRQPFSPGMCVSGLAYHQYYAKDLLWVWPRLLQQHVFPSSATMQYGRKILHKHVKDLVQCNAPDQPHKPFVSQQRRVGHKPIHP
jgi:hypothetical protein